MSCCAVVDGTLSTVTGLSLQTLVCKNLIGYHSFLSIWPIVSYIAMMPSLDLIQWHNIPPSATINPRHFSFVNTPFLWNTIPLHILQLSNPITFHTALRYFFLCKLCILNCSGLYVVIVNMLCTYICTCMFVWGTLLQVMPSVYPCLDII